MTSQAVAHPTARTGGDRRIIVIIGAPGAGKGTQAERLAAALGLPHVSTGELFRGALRSDSPLGRRVRETMDHGGLVPDAIVVDVVAQRLAEADAAAGAILDGFPRTVAQAVALDALLARAGTAVCAALYVEVSAERLLERLTGRRICTLDDQHVYHVASMPPRRAGVCDIDGAELRQRSDDTAETVGERLDTQLPPMFEVIDHYAEGKVLFPVQGDRPAQEVTADLLRILSNVRSA